MDNQSREGRHTTLSGVDTGTPALATDGSGERLRRLMSLLETIVRRMMWGRDRRHRESVDVVQSIAGNLTPDLPWLLELDEDSQRRFLVVVVRHKLAWYFRRETAAKRGPSGPRALLEPLDHASSHAGPATVACTAEELSAIRACLDKLEPESKAVIALHLAGVPYAEIANLLDTSSQVARQRFVRAKRDLLILVQRQSGVRWDEVAAATGLTPEEAERRHARLMSIMS